MAKGGAPALPHDEGMELKLFVDIAAATAALVDKSGDWGIYPVEISDIFTLWVLATSPFEAVGMVAVSLGDYKKPRKRPRK